MHDAKTRWDSQILVVYGVLAGLSFQQTFSFLASSTLSWDDYFLAVLVFAIVLENLIYLPIYLTVIDITTPIEAAFYFLALIAYSCIPFLLAVANPIPLKLLETFQWMIVNLILIVVCDTASKIATLFKMAAAPESWFDEEKLGLFGTYCFYALTGIFYIVLLPIVLHESTVLGEVLGSKSLVPFLSWFIIRMLDRLFIPKVTNIFAKILLSVARQKRR